MLTLAPTIKSHGSEGPLGGGRVWWTTLNENSLKTPANNGVNRPGQCLVLFFVAKHLRETDSERSPVFSTLF